MHHKVFLLKLYTPRMFAVCMCLGPPLCMHAHCCVCVCVCVCVVSCAMIPITAVNAAVVAEVRVE